MEWLDNIPTMIAVFGVGLAAFWAAFPAGVAFGLSPVTVIVVAVCSYMVRAIIVVLVGKPIRRMLMRRFEKVFGAYENSMFFRIWQRFGMIGLALVAPITFGSQFSAALAITLGVNSRRMLLWMTLGAVIWAGIFLLATHLGWTFIEAWLA